MESNCDMKIVILECVQYKFKFSIIVVNDDENDDAVLTFINKRVNWPSL